jgi:hypothetical protein
MVPNRTLNDRRAAYPRVSRAICFIDIAGRYMDITELLASLGIPASEG